MHLPLPLLCIIGVLSLPSNDRHHSQGEDRARHEIGHDRRHGEQAGHGGHGERGGQVDRGGHGGHGERGGQVDRGGHGGHGGRGRHRQLTDRARHSLERAFHRGIGLDSRKSRLENLGKKHFRNHKYNEHRQNRMKLSREKIERHRIELADSLVEHGDDLFEINANTGIDEYMFQGDINLTDEQLSDIESSIEESPSKRRRRQASLVYPKWTSNTLYYHIDSSINARKQTMIETALDYISNNTCVYFVNEETVDNTVKVFNGEGCYSVVGMVGGEQSLSIGDGCEVIGTIAHEFTHALGVFHTQMRSDRDDNIYVDLSYVDPTRQQNFVKYRSSDVKNFVPYEYGSMMHYSANAFTTDRSKLSMIPDDADYVYTMGNRQISFYDIKMINDFYECHSRCPQESSARCQNGGYPKPRQCSVCVCPQGYGGTTCSERPAGCGATWQATSTWTTQSYTFGNLTAVDLLDNYRLCNHWIKAPAGKKIQVKITEMLNSQCNYGCVYNGIEIKVKADKRLVNPRYCCPATTNIVFTSELNPTPIVSFNRYAYTKFSVAYRFV